MTERYTPSSAAGTSESSGFDAFAFSEEIKANPDVMAEAVEDVGARVSDFVEQYPDIALDPEFEARHKYIQRELGTLAFIRESVEDGRITGLNKDHRRRLQTLEEDAEDLLTSIGDVDIDPRKDPVRQLERVFSEGHQVPESLAPDIAAQVMESSQLIRDITKNEKVKTEGANDYLSSKIAVATMKAIELPMHRDDYDKAA